MTRPAFEVTTDMLHAYADGQLAENERATVEAYLGTHADAAQLVTQWQQQNEALSTLFAPVLGETVPDRQSPARIDAGVRDGRGRMLRGIAASLVVIAAAGSLGWYLRGATWAEEPLSERLIDNAVVAHALYVQENTHAVEVPANSPNLMRWLSNRIATPIDAPNLSAHGFTFLGARLLPGETGEHLHGPAAQLMYQNASAQRVTLYITAALPDKKEVWKFESRNGVEAYYWADADVTCTIVSDLPEKDVRDLGKSIFEQLTRKADSSWNPSSPAAS
jgi:anti-sigma factor RsiW